MGFSTDFIGHLDIEPALNDAEIEYLTAFTKSRRCRRPGGPYDVPGNPLAEDAADFPNGDYSVSADGQPQLWCDYEVCWEGCCLTWSGKEKSYAMVPWLRYLIDHFLRPGGLAQGHEGFDDFTFDHYVDGQLVGCRRDNKELFAVIVSDNQVRERVLRPADPRYLDRPPLPYEVEKDREETAFGRRRRRPRRSQDATVVALRPVSR